MIYLDNNATAPTRPEALSAMQPWLMGAFNPSSIHQRGRESRAAIEKARAEVAATLDVPPANVIFTASATEANHQALCAQGASALFVSAVEHASVLAVATKMGAHIIPVDNNGVVDLAALKTLLTQYPSPKPLVSVMLANNETGVIQPIAEIAAIARRFGALIHCDAVQGWGKIPFTLTDLGVDMITLSGHKAGAGMGAAALVVNGCMPVAPFLVGGGQELNRRAGTENVAAIAALGAVAALGVDTAQMNNLKHWREAMETKLIAAHPVSRVFGQSVARLPNTTCISLPGRENATQLMVMDLAGIAVSSGSACTSGKVERSHVLTAMGVDAEEAVTALRISSGWATVESDYQRFAKAWLEMAGKVKAHA